MDNVIISLPCIKLSGLLAIIEQEGLQATKDSVRELASAYPQLIDVDAAIDALDAFADASGVDDGSESGSDDHIVSFGHALGIGAVSYS